MFALAGRYARKAKIRKGLVAAVYLGFIAACYAPDSFWRVRCWSTSGLSQSVVQAQLGLAGQPICHSCPGVKHTPDGRR
jgi:hypothetical protein